MRLWLSLLLRLAENAADNIVQPAATRSGLRRTATAEQTGQQITDTAVDPRIGARPFLHPTHDHGRDDRQHLFDQISPNAGFLLRATGDGAADFFIAENIRQHTIAARPNVVALQYAGVVVGIFVIRALNTAQDTGEAAFAPGLLLEPGRNSGQYLSQHALGFLAPKAELPGEVFDAVATLSGTQKIEHIHIGPLWLLPVTLNRIRAYLNHCATAGGQLGRPAP